MSLPSAPTVTAVAISPYAINWNWTAGQYALGHRVMSASGGTNLSGDLSGSVTYWTMSPLSPDISTSVYVEAYNVSGTSAGAIVSKYTLADIPNPISIGSVGTATVGISFGANNNQAATQYSVEASTTVNNTFGEIYAGVWTPSIAHNGLAADTSYYYRIRAKNTENVYSDYQAIIITTITKVNEPSVVSFNAVNENSIQIGWNQANQSWTVYELWASTGNMSGYARYGREPVPGRSLIAR